MRLDENISRIKEVMGLVTEQTQSPEDNQEFLDWVKNATVMPFIAPNPYSNGNLKLGVQIKGNDGKTIASMD